MFNSGNDCGLNVLMEIETVLAWQKTSVSQVSAWIQKLRLMWEENFWINEKKLFELKNEDIKPVHDTF